MLLVQRTTERRCCERKALEEKRMKPRQILLAVGLVVALVLVGCGKAEPTAAPVVDIAGGEGRNSPRGVLQGTSALVLGMLKLEGTEHAVTPEQAAKLLPLWQVIQGGSLQGAAETEAVLKQIEGVLEEDQLAAIDGMELTFQDIGAWMESPSAKALGIEMPARPEGQNGRPGGGAFQNMTEEQRTQLRQELQNMTPEQRATRMAEMGFQRPEGGAGPGGFSGGGGGGFLVGPLIELLSERAAE
jgi:hypothetical protein